MPGLVPTARELQDHYMSGGGSSITIDSQAFYNSYGRFAPLVERRALKMCSNLNTVMILIMYP